MKQMLLAQIRNPVLPPSIGGGTSPTTEAGGTALGGIISSLVGGLFIAAFLLAFVYLLTGGITWITSGSDKAKLEQARNQITHALIGLIVVASAWALTAFAGQFLGLDIRALTFPTIPSQIGQ